MIDTRESSGRCQERQESTSAVHHDDALAYDDDDGSILPKG